MPFFNRSFEPHIWEELSYRKTFENVQTSLIPHVRVTSLVAGTLHTTSRWSGLVNEQQINGFTLGLSDVTAATGMFDPLTSHLNIPGGTGGTAVGITYTGDEGSPVPVVIDTGPKKLPSPGITDVEISTETKGGYTFLAKIRLKFYGKEQYNFIWQTFMRPGNPIAIEFGHTRPDETLNDLQFFQTLNQDVIDAFRDNMRENKSLMNYRNCGAATGFVTNFNVALNEQNEYEAEIEIINSLEFLFTVSPEDTFLQYGPNIAAEEAGLKGLSKSIKSNFGVQSGDSYNPEYDTIFDKVLYDAVTPPVQVDALHPAGRAEAATDRRQSILLPHGLEHAFTVQDYSEDVDRDGDGVVDTYNDEPIAVQYHHIRLSNNTRIYSQEDLKTYALEHSDHVYISLDYFLHNLLNHIIQVSYFDRQNVCQSNINAGPGGMNFNPRDFETEEHHEFRQDEIEKLEEAYKDARMGKLRLTFGAPTERASAHVYDQELIQSTKTSLDRAKAVDLNPWSQEFYITPATEAGKSATSTLVDVDDGSIAYWPDLRSVNTHDVIINNATLYNVTDRLVIDPDAFADDDAQTSQEGLLRRGWSWVLQKLEKIQTITEEQQKTLDQASVYFFNKRSEGYKDKFEWAEDADQLQFAQLFNFVPWWSAKEIYGGETAWRTRRAGQGRNSGLKTNFKGIYLNYSKVRSAFMTSNSVAEAITKILNMVNVASAGTFRLKLRFVESYMVKSEGTGGEEWDVFNHGAFITKVNKIKIYDEAVVPSKNEQTVPIYPFFENNLSEAISYNFDMNLPSTVAATVLSNTFQANEMSSAGGDPMSKHTISYGYAMNLEGTGPALTSLVNVKVRGQLGEGTLVNTNRCVAGGPVRESDPDEAEKGLQAIEGQNFHSRILGYRELDPPKMKSDLISAGYYHTVPSAGQVNIKLQGLAGFRFGDMFMVHNMVPDPFDDNHIFMVTGHKHTISNEGWFTDLTGQMISSMPADHQKRQETLRQMAKDANSEEEQGQG